MSKLDSNIPRKSISKERRSSVKPNKYYRVEPNLKKLSERVLEPDCYNHAFSLKADKAEKIWQYSKTLCTKYFQQKFVDNFFSQGFSTAKTNRFEHRSNMGTQRTNAYVESIDNSLDCLNDIFQSNPASLYALTDFVLLYCSLVISICSVESCVQKTLFFVRKFLQGDMQSRPNEVIVLFTAIMNLGVESAPIIEICKQVLYLTAKSNRDLEQGIEKGLTRKNKTNVEICKGVKEKLSKFTEQAEIEQNTDMSELTDEEAVLNRIKAFNRPLGIKNPSDYVRDLLIAMQTFHESYPIITAACQSIISHIDKCTPIDKEILGEFLAVIIDTVMQTPKTNQEQFTDAVLAVNDLFETFVTSQGPDAVIEAAPEAHILLNSEKIEKLNEYIDALKETAPVQEVVQEQPQPVEEEAVDEDEAEPILDPSLQHSIELLLNPDTVFKEMERIIQNDEDLIQYPLYLRGFLQRSYYLYKRKIPPAMNDYQLSLAKKMAEDLDNNNKSDFQPGGRLHVDTLMNEFQRIKSIIE